MSTVYDKDFDYQAKANQYRLVVAHPCPFAHRTTIARELLGLEDVVSLGTTSNIKTDKIWDFSNHEDCKDPVLGVEYVSDLYKNTNPSYDGPFSVPALVDESSKTVVNHESLDIIIDFATRFKSLGKNNLDLYPNHLQEEIDGWFQRIGTEVLGTPYRAGSAKNQKIYDRSVEIFYNALTELDTHFKTHEYLIGDQLTLADIVLFTPLVRLDVVYANLHGVNKYRLQDFPNLWAYMHKLYQIPAFKNTTSFEDIKEGSFLGKTGRGTFVTRQAVPAGPDTSIWDQPLK